MRLNGHYQLVKLWSKSGYLVTNRPAFSKKNQKGKDFVIWCYQNMLPSSYYFNQTDNVEWNFTVS